MGISINIITKNEEKKIADCLRSVSWADEIVVLDSESSDGTVEFCREYTDKVYIAPWVDYSTQRNRAIALSTHEWILALDADERVTPDLQAEIERIVDGQPVENGFYIPRKNYIGNYWLKSKRMYPNYQLRLFRRSYCEFSNSIHEKPIIPGEIGYLTGHLDHFSFDNLHAYADKVNRYSSVEAQYVNPGFNKTYYLLIRPFLKFFNQYVMLHAYRDGWYGLSSALLEVFYDYMKYAKALEIARSTKEH